MDQPSIPPALRWPNLWKLEVPLHHDHTPAYTERLGAVPGESVRLWLRSDLPLERAWLVVRVDGELENQPAQPVSRPGLPGHWFEASLELIEARSYYAWGYTLQGGESGLLTMAGPATLRPAFREWFQYLALPRDPWPWSQVFYQIFPDRFRAEGESAAQLPWNRSPQASDGARLRYGGNLAGVQAALGYLKDLGVSALWLNPIFVSPSNHRYDISDYLSVDPALGGNAAWDHLIQAAHAEGIRIVLDGVFNHTGSQHPYFVDALKNPSSPWRELYSWRERAPGYASFKSVAGMPKLNYGSELTYRLFLDGPEAVVRHWLRRGADGWRLDVAHMMGEGGHDRNNLEVHRRLRRAALEEAPSSYVFGERFFDAEASLGQGGEDAVMNYHGFGLPVLQWFCGRDHHGLQLPLGGEALVHLLWDAYHVLPAPTALSQFNLIESHDIPRALYRLGGDRGHFLAATAFLLTYPGVPCLYYGSEVGLSQERGGSDAHCRAPMPWDPASWDGELRAAVRQLIALRRSRAALIQGNLRWLAFGEDVLGYSRTYSPATGPAEQILVLISRKEGARLRLQLPEGLWRSALGNEVFSGGPQELEPSGFLILLPAASG
jgi:alpha-glucosidase